jgi:flagellar motor switch protein FliM
MIMDQTEAKAMGDTARSNALEKMATRHRAAQAQERAVFEAALRVAFGRMSADCPGLEGIVQGVGLMTGALAEVLELAEPGMFLALLEGQGDRMGLLMASPAVLAGMVEAQTTGRVDQAEVAPRIPTRTDAALLAPMIDTFLRLLEARCVDLPQSALVSGYGYGSFIDNPRPLGLMLEEGQFHILRLHVALGYGAKEGDWFLILPEPEGTSLSPVQDELQLSELESDWQERLQVAIGESGVVLDSVLCRVQLTLTDALRLRVGDVLRLPETALETLTLESIARTALGIGRLGQARGQRAVRLTADPGVLTDATGASVPQIALPASIIWAQPAQPPFSPSPSDPDALTEPAAAHRVSDDSPDP